MHGAAVLGALVLALLMFALASLAVEALSAELTVHIRHDFQHAIWAEREARRLLRARYASGQVSQEEYRRLSYELEKGRSV